ncbi:MAG: CBS domain-containing protein [Cryomorphaceae bacterium]|nr:CBS domain-containing protein [Cryomorphaceae bacterium]
MLASELIDTSVRNLHPQQTVGEALNILQELMLSQAIVMSDQKALAMVSESFLLDQDEATVLETLLPSLPPPPGLADNQSELEAIRLMAENKLELLPIINQDGDCLGIISLRSAFFRMGQKFAPPIPGGILVLQVHPLNYQLSQIAQIVESGDASINAMYLQGLEKENAVLVTIFTNKEDLDGIVQTFKRYNYEVIGTFFRSIDENRLQERYQSLMRYLNT